MPKLDRSGHFRGTVIESSSKSLANGTPQVRLKVLVDEEWRGGQWVGTDLGLEVEGWFGLVKADGKPNEYNLNQFKKWLEWDGTLLSIYNGELNGKPIQVEVEKREFTRGKPLVACIKWLNAYESTPGVRESAQVLSIEEIMALDAKFGSLLRTGGAFVPPKPVELQTGDDSPF